MATNAGAGGSGALALPAGQTELVNRELARGLMSGHLSIYMARTYIQASLQTVGYTQFVRPASSLKLAPKPEHFSVVTARDAVAHRVSHISESFTPIRKMIKSESWRDIENQIVSYGADDTTAALLAFGRLNQNGFNLDEFAVYRNSLAHVVHFSANDLLWIDVMLDTGWLETARKAIEAEMDDPTNAPLLKQAFPNFRRPGYVIPKAFTLKDFQDLKHREGIKDDGNDDLL